MEHIDHTRTKGKSPQANGVVERFHKPILNEFSRITFRKKISLSLMELQADLDRWLPEYPMKSTHTKAGGVMAKRRSKRS